MRATVGTSAGLRVTWDRLVTNGGGLLPGLAIADDGTKVCYTDTAGAYVYDDANSIWRQIAGYLQNHNADQYEWVGYRGMVGLADCQIAPSNSNYIYYLMSDIWFNNRLGRAFLSKSTDKGLTSNITSYPANTQADAATALILGTNHDTFKRVQCKIGIDPINENVVYVSNPGGQSLVTFDGGVTFSNVPSLPVGTVQSVGASCWQFDRSSGTTTVNGQTVTNIIYCVVEGSGAWQSTNGGVSFSQISSSVGLLRPGSCSISADGVYYVSDAQVVSASVVGGTGGVSSITLVVASVNSGTLYPGAPITGSGVSGGTYIVKQASGTPGGVGSYTISAAATVADGTTISVASATYSLLHRYQSSAWGVIWQSQLTLSNPIRNRIAVAAHPTTNGTVVAVNSSGTPRFLASSDYGTTWSRTNKVDEIVSASAESPWYVEQIDNPSNTFASQQCVFNRDDGKLYLNYGQGMVRADVTVGVVPTWEAFNVGIEQTVCYGVCCESGVTLLQVVNDELAFQHANPSGLQTPPTETIAGVLGLNHGWSGCIDPYDPQNQVIMGNGAVSTSTSQWHYSTDGGTTWSLMANTPPSGLWAAYTAPIIRLANGVCLWAPAQSSTSAGTQANMYRTDDFGATAWVELDHSHFDNGANFPSTIAQGWGTGSLLPKGIIAFDRVNPSKVYAYNVLHGLSPAIKGMYLSTDAGVNWTYQGTGTDPAAANSFGFIDIKAVPGVEGTAYATVGYNATQPPPNAGTAFSLYKIVENAGALTISVVSSAIKEANYIGWGKAGPSGNPTLFVAGFHHRSYGIFMSEDLGTSWRQLVSNDYGPWPMHNDAVYGVEGDKDVFGRCYVSFRGSGSVYSTLV